MTRPTGHTQLLVAPNKSLPNFLYNFLKSEYFIIVIIVVVVISISISSCRSGSSSSSIQKSFLCLLLPTHHDFA